MSLRLNRLVAASRISRNIPVITGNAKLVSLVVMSKKKKSADNLLVLCNSSLDFE